MTQPQKTIEQFVEEEKKKYYGTCLTPTDAMDDFRFALLRALRKGMEMSLEVGRKCEMNIEEGACTDCGRYSHACECDTWNAALSAKNQAIKDLIALTEKAV